MNAMFPNKKITLLFSVFIFLLFIFVFAKNFLITKSDQDPLFDSYHYTSPSNIPRNFVLFTLPKTGTHLMRPLLECLTNKFSVPHWSSDIRYSKSYLYDKNMLNVLSLIPNVVQTYWLNPPIPSHEFTALLENFTENENFFVTHASFSIEMEKILKERNYVVFFLIRDPRDWIISVLNHTGGSGVDLYGNPHNEKHFAALATNDKIEYVIRGTGIYYSALEAFEKFIPWISSPICCPILFEKLLGPKGGLFSEKEQIAELRKIADALHLNISDQKLLENFNESFGEEGSFFKGKPGVWKDYFDEDLKDLFKEYFGSLLIELGYEKDSEW